MPLRGNVVITCAVTGSIHTPTMSPHLPLTPDERLGAERAAREGLPLRITPHYLSLIDRNDPSCPIRRQCVPLASEAVMSEGDLVDPLGEVAHEVALRRARARPAGGRRAG